jgi:hypothetical protein
MTNDALAKRAVHRIVRMADRKGGVTLERGVRGEVERLLGARDGKPLATAGADPDGDSPDRGLAAALPSASAVL